MAAFDELYYRFFRNAVQCCIQAETSAKDDPMGLGCDVEIWYAESLTWGRAALALRPYMSQTKVRNLEQAVMRGVWTLNESGRVVLIEQPAKAK